MIGKQFLPEQLSKSCEDYGIKDESTVKVRVSIPGGVRVFHSPMKAYLCIVRGENTENWFFTG